MPRRPRVATGGVVYHVLNRAAGRLTLFRTDGDYAAFLRVLAEACRRSPGVRLLCYCLMPNHFHLVLWPRRDGELSEFMRWLTVTHAQRLHARRHNAGTGPVYQGRFKSFPVEREDMYFLVVCRYVERNALRANRVSRAQDWRWCSLWAREQPRGTGGKRRESGDDAQLPPLLPRSEWPVEARRDWVAWVNTAETEKELEALRRSARRGTPYGSGRWALRTAEALGLLPTLRPRGRPPKRPRDEPAAHAARK
jgi:putative transposase